MTRRSGGGQALGMALGTALSRATGLLRTVALAWAIGVTALGDAYNTANTAPNMIFQLAAGGVLTSALVPLLVRQNDAKRRLDVVSILLTITLVVGIAASLVLAIAAPAVMRLLTLGARGRSDYEQFLSVGTSWLRMFAPQVALYAVSVFAVGVLQARGRLRLAGFAPVVANLVTIAAAVAFVATSDGRMPLIGEIGAGQVALLGWGTTLAVGAMAAVQLWGATRSEPGLRFLPRFGDPVVAEIRRLGSWVVVYVVVNQLGYAVIVGLANSVVGGVTAYQWAFTVMQLPYAIVAVSILAAATPALSRAAAQGGEVAVQVANAARSILALLIPAAVGLALLADRLAESLVGGAGAGLVSAGIRGFALSLVPFSLFQLLVRTSYAHQDTRGPARVNAAVNLVNVLAAVVVVVLMSSPGARVAGLALSHGLSYLVGTVLLGSSLHRHRGVGLGAWTGGTGKVLSATVLMVAVLAPAIAVAPQPSARPGIIAVAGGLAAVGAAAYLLAGRGLRMAMPLRRARP